MALKKRNTCSICYMKKHLVLKKPVNLNLLIYPIPIKNIRKAL
jgi:hypothetical protein